MKGYLSTDIFAADSGTTSYVDMYNATSNSWTTHPTGLGQARAYLAAASLPPGLVFFAGGWIGHCCARSDLLLHMLFFSAFDGGRPVLRLFAYIVSDSCVVDREYSSYVDVYDAMGNNWTTYPEGLGQARGKLASASLASGLVFFAGGYSGASGYFHDCFFNCALRNFYSCSGTKASVVLMLCEADNVARIVRSSACADAFASGSGPSPYVDMYNATSNSWTRFPTGLGQARQFLAAASLPSGLVFFAGGVTC